MERTSTARRKSLPSTHCFPDPRFIVFKHRFPIHKIFERSCEIGLWRLTANRISELFVVRLNMRLQGKLATWSTNSIVIACRALCPCFFTVERRLRMRAKILAPSNERKQPKIFSMLRRLESMLEGR